MSKEDQSDMKVQTKHPQKGKTAPRIEKDKYDAFKKAILGAVPRKAEGIRFMDLPQAVASRLPAAVRAKVGSVSWYTTVIKLDLEARGAIERVPGSSPQRLRRSR